MKKSMMKSVFAIMATAMMSTANLCAQSAETTYIYGQEKENNLTVYTLNEDGETVLSAALAGIALIIIVTGQSVIKYFQNRKAG